MLVLLVATAHADTGLALDTGGEAAASSLWCWLPVCGGAFVALIGAAAYLLWVGRRERFLFKSPEDIDRELFAAGVPTRGRARSGVAEAETPRDPVDLIAQADADFSLPGLLDLVLVLHRTATLAAHAGTLDELAVWVSPVARKALAAAHSGPAPDLLTVRSIALRDHTHGQHWTTVTAHLTVLRRRGEQAAVRTEQWQLRRGALARSKPPLEMLALRCPECGAEPSVDAQGHCLACEAPILWGQTQWQVHAVTLGEEGAPPGIPAPASATPPSRAGATELRDFQLRHPDFDLPAFLQLVADVVGIVAPAAAAGDWARVRPYVTDRVLNAALYRAAVATEPDPGGDVHIEGMKVAAVREDPYYERVTVWVAGRRGDAPFQELWALRCEPRVADKPIVPAASCPACRHPADRVAPDGVCGYCHKWVTTGHHRWVVEQAPR